MTTREGLLLAAEICEEVRGPHEKMGEMTKIEQRRAESSRLYRFWCWLWYGHDREAPGRSVEICDRCGSHILGGD